MSIQSIASSAMMPSAIAPATIPLNEGKTPPSNIITKMTSAGVQSGIMKAVNPAGFSAASATTEKNSKEVDALKDVTREVVTIGGEKYNAYVSKKGNFRTLYTYQAGLLTTIERALFKKHAQLNKRAKGVQIALFVSKKFFLEILEETRKKYESKCANKTDTFLLNTVATAVKSAIETSITWEKQDDKDGFKLGEKPQDDWLKILSSILNYLLKTWIKEVGRVEIFMEDLKAFKLSGAISIQDPMFYNCLEWALLRSGAIDAKRHLFDTITNHQEQTDKLLKTIIPTLKSWNYIPVEFENIQPKDLVIYLDADNNPVHAAVYMGKDGKGFDFESKFGFKNKFFHRHRLFDTPLTEGSLEVKALIFRKPANTMTAD